MSLHTSAALLLLVAALLCAGCVAPPGGEGPGQNELSWDFDTAFLSISYLVVHADNANGPNSLYFIPRTGTSLAQGVQLSGDVATKATGASCPSGSGSCALAASSSSGANEFMVLTSGGGIISPAEMALTIAVKCYTNNKKRGVDGVELEERVVLQEGPLSDFFVDASEHAAARNVNGATDPQCYAAIYSGVGCDGNLFDTILTQESQSAAGVLASPSNTVGCLVFGVEMGASATIGTFQRAVVGDPHFYALDGSGAEYTPVGRSGSVYNLITLPNFQLSSLWEAVVADNERHAEATWNTAMGVMCGDDRLEVRVDDASPQGYTVALNGAPLATDADAAVVRETGACSYSVHRRAVQVVSPAYTLRIESSVADGHPILNLRAIVRDAELAATAHGVLGQTARAGYPLAVDATAGYTDAGRELACALYIAGFHEMGEAALDRFYMPADNTLFGTDFFYNQFAA